MNIIEQEQLYQKRIQHDTRFMFKPADENGYFTNLFHPEVLEAYKKFRKERNIPYFAPLDDNERHEFDCNFTASHREDFQLWQKHQLMYTGGAYGRACFVPVRNGSEICETDSA